MFVDINELRKMAYGSTKKSQCKSDSKSVSELVALLSTIDKHLQEAELEKACYWMLQEDLWLQNENNLLSSFYNYSRGDIIISLDLGTSNIGTEIRYPHPCIVLYDNGEDWVIVAPITAVSKDDDGNPIIHKPFEIFVSRQPKPPSDRGEFHFRKDSVIQVDQIRRVSKYRASNKSKLKLRTDILNQIDNVIINNILPKKAKLLEKMKSIVLKQEAEIKTNLEKISRLNSEVDSLSQKVAELNIELQKYKLRNVVN